MNALIYRGKGFRLYEVPLIDFDMDECLKNNSDRLKRDPAEKLDIFIRLLCAGADSANHESAKF